MKKAEEYFAEMSTGKQTASRWIEIIRKAQNDAYNSAIEEAAEFAEEATMWGETADGIRYAILDFKK